MFYPRPLLRTPHEVDLHRHELRLQYLIAAWIYPISVWFVCFIILSDAKKFSFVIRKKKFTITARATAENLRLFFFNIYFSSFNLKSSRKPPAFNDDLSSARLWFISSNNPKSNLKDLRSIYSRLDRPFAIFRRLNRFRCSSNRWFVDEFLKNCLSQGRS